MLAGFGGRHTDVGGDRLAAYHFSVLSLQPHRSRCFFRVALFLRPGEHARDYRYQQDEAWHSCVLPLGEEGGEA